MLFSGGKGGVGVTCGSSGDDEVGGGLQARSRAREGGRIRV